MLEDNMQVVEDGGEPINTFRDPATNQYLELPTESDARFTKFGPARQRGGAATKYSPIMIEREGAVKY